jgi:hypothetical protein
MNPTQNSLTFITDTNRMLENNRTCQTLYLPCTLLNNNDVKVVQIKDHLNLNYILLFLIWTYILEKICEVIFKLCVKWGLLGIFILRCFKTSLQKQRESLLSSSGNGWGVTTPAIPFSTGFCLGDNSTYRSTLIKFLSPIARELDVIGCGISELHDPGYRILCWPTGQRYLSHV